MLAPWATWHAGRPPTDRVSYLPSKRPFLESASHSHSAFNRGIILYLFDRLESFCCEKSYSASSRGTKPKRRTTAGRDERLPKNFPGNPRFHYVAYHPYPGIIDPASGENNIDGCQLDDPDINTAIGHWRTCVPASRRRPPAPAGLPCCVCYLPS